MHIMVLETFMECLRNVVHHLEWQILLKLPV